MGWLTPLTDRLGRPELRFAQVEVTTHCDGKCLYCPAPTFSNPCHMGLSFFRERVLPELAYTEMVYLQGWGEPLLNPHINEMIRLCRKKGKRVGFTTRGALLFEGVRSFLIENQVETLGVTLAGTRAESHNAVRSSSDFQTICTHLKELHKEKISARSDFPQVHIAFLLTPQAMAHLDELPELALSLGAASVVISAPVTALRENFPSRLAIPYENTPDVIQILRRESQRSRALGISAHINPIHTPAVEGPCTEPVTSSCVISVDGSVSPCVFASPTVASAPQRCLSFGNLSRESLTKIWHQPDYRAFRTAMNSDTPDTRPGVCTNCPKRGCLS